jgi:uncharacterized protein YndB with AHSA1/START domain
VAEIVLSVDVPAPAAAVFAAAMDWERQETWMLGTRVRPVGGTGRASGDRILAVTGWGPAALRDLMEITVWEPPRRCLVRHLGRLVRGTGAFEVEERPDGGSRFVWSEWLDLPLGLLGEVGFLVVRPVFVAGLRYSLRRFARQVAG